MGKLTKGCIFCIVTMGNFCSLRKNGHYILDSLAGKRIQLPLDLGLELHILFSENRPEGLVDVDLLHLFRSPVSIILGTVFLTLL